MFGTNIARGNLSFSKVLSGISKSLGIVNQAIPIYKEIKPMISNARKVIDIAKEFNKTNNLKTIDVSEKKEVVKKNITTSTINNSNPVFFQ
mgnify:FL=1